MTEKEIQIKLLQEVVNAYHKRFGSISVPFTKWSDEDLRKMIINNNSESVHNFSITTTYEGKVCIDFNKTVYSDQVNDFIKKI